MEEPERVILTGSDPSSLNVMVILSLKGLETLSESRVPLLLITPVTVEAPMVAEHSAPLPAMLPRLFVMVSIKPG